MTYPKQGGLPALVVVLIFVAVAACQQPASNARQPVGGVTLLGDKGHPTKVFQLSSDGRAAVGYIFDGNKPDNSPGGGLNHFHSFYWTETGGLQLIKTATGADVEVRAISANGLVAVGRFYVGYQSHVFHWTQASGLEDLGAPDGHQFFGCGACSATATAVSADGSVIYGRLINHSSFRWTRATGIRDLHIRGEIVSSSADGLTAMGVRFVGDGPDRPFLWTAAKGFRDLGVPPGTFNDDYGLGVEPAAMSSDGSTIAGEFAVAKGDMRGFRWTRDHGYQTLPGGETASVRAVSADGSQIAGAVLDPGRRVHPVRWIGASPPKPIGIPGVAVLFATAISGDGRVIAGATKLDGETHAFLARLD